APRRTLRRTRRDDPRPPQRRTAHHPRRTKLDRLLRDPLRRRGRVSVHPHPHPRCRTDRRRDPRQFCPPAHRRTPAHRRLPPPRRRGLPPTPRRLLTAFLLQTSYFPKMRRLLPPLLTGVLLLLAWLALHTALPASQQFLLPTPARIFTE